MSGMLLEEMLPWKVAVPPFMHPSVEEEVLDFGWRELIVSVYRSSNLSVALWNVDSVDPKLGAHALHVQCVLALAPHGFFCNGNIRKCSAVAVSYAISRVPWANKVGLYR